MFYSNPIAILERACSYARPAPCMMLVTDSQPSPVSACWQDGLAEAAHALLRAALAFGQPEGIMDDHSQPCDRLEAAFCVACSCMQVRSVWLLRRGPRRGCLCCALRVVVGRITLDPSGPTLCLVLQRRSGSVATFIASARSLTVCMGTVLSCIVSGPNFGVLAVCMNVETDQP